LNGGRLRARTLAPVAGNAGSYPARRTKSKRSRQTDKISACIIHGEDGHGSLSEQPTRPYGSSLSPGRMGAIASESATIHPEWCCLLAAGRVRKDVWPYRRDGHSSEVRRSRADVSMLPSQDFSGVVRDKLCSTPRSSGGARRRPVQPVIRRLPAPYRHTAQTHNTSFASPPPRALLSARIRPTMQNGVSPA